MYFNVLQKRNPSSAPGKRENSGQQEKRQPRYPYEKDQSTIEQFQMISFEMCSAKELEEWTTEHYREIGRFSKRIWFDHCACAIRHSGSLARYHALMPLSARRGLTIS